MRSWNEFRQLAPEFAEAGARLLECSTLAFLATTGGDGRPRLHPFIPVVCGDDLVAFVNRDSPKHLDLDRRGYYAIHTLPGEEDEEFFIAGKAEAAFDIDARAKAASAMPYDDVDEHLVLYRFLIDRALWTTWEGFGTANIEPVHRNWREKSYAGGRVVGCEKGV